MKLWLILHVILVLKKWSRKCLPPKMACKSEMQSVLFEVLSGLHRSDRSDTPGSPSSPSFLPSGLQGPPSRGPESEAESSDSIFFRQSLSPGVFQLGPTRRSPAGVEVGVACPISVQLQVLMEPASWGRGFNGCFSKAAAFCPPAPSASLAAVFPACSLDSLTTLTVFKTHTCSPLGETGSLGGSGRGYKADTLLPVE